MTGNPALDKALLGLNGIVVAAAAALVVYSHTMIKKPDTDTKKEFTDMARNAMVEYKKQTVVFKEDVVNLYSRERRLRFLNIIMNIEVYEDGQQAIIETMKPAIIDAMIDITGNLKPEELNSITGKILLEARIKTKANELIKKQVVKKIFFSKFIIQ